ncbi:MAG: carbohydrate ABC transporter permease [Salinibacterium sp.]|nr:carbohydrate ABC transporter permease [Salinibacterium sp.]
MLSRMDSKWSRILSGGIVLLALAVVVGPLLWVVRVSLRPVDEFILAPTSLGGTWTFENIIEAVTVGEMGFAILNSLIVISVGAPLAVLLGSMSGFALARFKFLGRGIAAGLISTAIFLPVAAIVIPLFNLALSLRMVNSLIWLAVIYGIIFSSWVALFLRSYFLQLPTEVFEAAQVDGAGSIRTFVSVALPMAKPALATAFVLSCFIQWSELLIALLLLPNGDTPTVALGIAQFSTQYRSGGPQTAAAMIVGVLPILLIFLVGQRWLRVGSLAGSVKD